MPTWFDYFLWLLEKIKKTCRLGSPLCLIIVMRSIAIFLIWSYKSFSYQESLINSQSMMNQWQRVIVSFSSRLVAFSAVLISAYFNYDVCKIQVITQICLTNIYVSQFMQQRGEMLYLLSCFFSFGPFRFEKTCHARMVFRFPFLLSITSKKKLSIKIVCWLFFELFFHQPSK